MKDGSLDHFFRKDVSSPWMTPHVSPCLPIKNAYNPTPEATSLKTTRKGTFG